MIRFEDPEEGIGSTVDVSGSVIAPAHETETENTERSNPEDSSESATNNSSYGSPELLKANPEFAEYNDLTQYTESEENAEKIMDLRAILQTKKSTEVIEYAGMKMPMFMAWNEQRNHFKKYLNDRDLPIETLEKVRLWHVLGGSSDIGKKEIERFDLDGGEIEKFIRTGKFGTDDSVPAETA